MNTRTYPELTTEDVAALRSYAIERGPKWKDDLGIAWYNARLEHCHEMPERGTILHGIRNNFGPSWLLDVFTFAEPLEFPNMRKLRAGEVRDIVQAYAGRDARREPLTEAERIQLWAARRERSRRASR